MTETQELKAGSTLTLAVNYAGNPHPKLTWYLKDEEISYTETREDISTLRLTNVSVKDTGVYKVVAENSAGSDSAEFSVVVKGRYGKISKNFNLTHDFYFRQTQPTKEYPC